MIFYPSKTTRIVTLLTSILTIVTAVCIYSFATTVSKDLTITIVPSGGNGSIQCAYGPNHNGSIPAPAAAAGFNTCAANYDWTYGSNFTTNGHTYNFSDITSWLDCKGAGTPLWWNHSFSGGNTTPCNDFSIVNDGGTNVLQMTYTTADQANQGGGGANNTTMQTVQPNTGNGISSLPTGFAFPEQFYVEFKGRITTPDSNYNGLLADWWSLSATPNSYYMELDFIEMYSSTNDASGANQGLTIFPEVHYANSGVVSGYNHNNYNTFGERVTTDTNGNASICFYVNGVQVAAHGQNGWGQTGNCATGQWPNSYQLQELLTLLITSAIVSGSMSGPVTIHTQYFRLFTCAGWNTGNPAGGYACASSPVSSNP